MACTKAAARWHSSCLRVSRRKVAVERPLKSHERPLKSGMHESHRKVALIMSQGEPQGGSREAAVKWHARKPPQGGTHHVSG